MSAAKRKGSAAEKAVVQALQGAGFRAAERRVMGGTQDRGDIAGIPGVVIEVKNHKTLDLADWLDEAEVERRNDQAAIGAVWHKRRGRGDAADWYVTMPGWAFLILLAAWCNEGSEAA